MFPCPAFRRVLAAAVLLATLGTAAARDGTPDPSFGFAADGVFGSWFDYLPGGSVEETARAVVVHEGGAITVVGHFRKPGSDDFDCGIVRALPNGSNYDPAFMPPAGYGTLSFNLGGNDDDVCHAMLALPAGQVLIAGGSGILAPGERAGTLIRLQADGALDPTFFGDGMFDTLTDLSLSEPQVAITFEHLPRLASGRLVAAGNIVREDLYSRAFVLSVVETGVDPAFNAGAPLELGDDSLPSLMLTGVAEDSQQRLHLLGTALDPLDIAGVPHHGVLLRLLPDGSLDPAFGVGGRLQLPQCSGTGALALDATGILLGCAPPQGGPLAGVMRLGSDGSPDPGFGVAGHAEIRMESWDQSFGLGSGIGPPVALQVADNGFVIALATYLVRGDLRARQGTTDLAVARMSANGQLDPDFGNGGFDGAQLGTAHYQFGRLSGSDARTETGAAMAIDPNGGLLVVGGRNRPTATAGTAEFITARLLLQRGEAIFRNGFDEP